MKFLSTLLMAASLVRAMPLTQTLAAIEEYQGIPVANSEEAELFESSLEQNDLVNGDSQSCPKAILVWARGTLELGNMGIVVGPILAKTLESEFGGDIWIQGVDYPARLSSNFKPKGTDQSSIDQAKELFKMANKKCPKTPVIAAGYSQGTAVVGNALTELSGPAKDQVVGATMFGYTKNKQNRGVIPNFPAEKTKIFCEPGDMVCKGSLIIMPGHFLYADDASGPASQFITDRVNGAGF